MIAEAVDALNADGVKANHVQVKWMVPFHADKILAILSKAKKTIIVENNFSGQFARYLRSETGFAADGHIRKYDGEPFMPHHIVDGVKAQVHGETDKYIPYQEIAV
jgi:2-oxoglutarate ferredoxin oxidoreductase subunit alpha